jgi:DNA-binding PadR family transcriptional regulator
MLEEEPMHGYQLMQAIADRTEGAWRPSPGAVYPTIAQLEDEGMVSVAVDAGRKLVRLSEAGRQYAAHLRATTADPFESNHANRGRELRVVVQQIQAAARAVTSGGSPEQIAAAEKILAQARRSLYLLLADGADGVGFAGNDLA